MLDMIVICEGQTEREFCRAAIAAYLAASGIALAGTLVGKPQKNAAGSEIGQYTVANFFAWRKKDRRVIFRC
jgi:hypothetical protein